LNKEIFILEFENIIKEKNDLQEKTYNLEKFIYSSKIKEKTKIEQMLLKEQLNYMRNYLEILRERINIIK
jgi:hypothetical protein